MWWSQKAQSRGFALWGQCGMWGSLVLLVWNSSGGALGCHLPPGLSPFPSWPGLMPTWYMETGGGGSWGHKGPQLKL